MDSNRKRGETMAKELVIKVSKCIVILTEAELMACLAAKPEVFKRAIGRGKGYRRAMSTEKRLKQCERQKTI